MDVTFIFHGSRRFPFVAILPPTPTVRRMASARGTTTTDYTPPDLFEGMESREAGGVSRATAVIPLFLAPRHLAVAVVSIITVRARRSISLWIAGHGEDDRGGGSGGGCDRTSRSPSDEPG